LITQRRNGSKCLVQRKPRELGGVSYDLFGGQGY
jgi:hypothetical protein